MHHFVRLQIRGRLKSFGENHTLYSQITIGHHRRNINMDTSFKADFRSWRWSRANCYVNWLVAQFYNLALALSLSFDYPFQRSTLVFFFVCNNLYYIVHSYLCLFLSPLLGLLINRIKKKKKESPCTVGATFKSLTKTICNVMIH